MKGRQSARISLEWEAFLPQMLLEFRGNRKRTQALRTFKIVFIKNITSTCLNCAGAYYSQANSTSKFFEISECYQGWGVLQIPAASPLPGRMPDTGL